MGRKYVLYFYESSVSKRELSHDADLGKQMHETSSISVFPTKRSLRETTDTILIASVKMDLEEKSLLSKHVGSNNELPLINTSINIKS